VLRVADARAIHRVEIEKTIKDSVSQQVQVSVGEWGQSPDTKKFITDLRNTILENDALLGLAQIQLDNSYVRSSPFRMSVFFFTKL
jgi:hypothetical protein